MADSHALAAGKHAAALEVGLLLGDELKMETAIAKLHTQIAMRNQLITETQLAVVTGVFIAMVAMLAIAGTGGLAMVGAGVVLTLDIGGIAAAATEWAIMAEQIHAFDATIAADQAELPPPTSGWVTVLTGFTSSIGVLKAQNEAAQEAPIDGLVDMFSVLVGQARTTLAALKEADAAGVQRILRVLDIQTAIDDWNQLGTLAQDLLDCTVSTKVEQPAAAGGRMTLDRAAAPDPATVVTTALANLDAAATAIQPYLDALAALTLGPQPLTIDGETSGSWDPLAGEPTTEAALAAAQQHAANFQQNVLIVVNGLPGLVVTVCDDGNGQGLVPDLTTMIDILGQLQAGQPETPALRQAVAAALDDAVSMVAQVQELVQYIVPSADRMVTHMDLDGHQGARRRQLVGRQDARPDPDLHHPADGGLRGYARRRGHRERDRRDRPRRDRAAPAPGRSPRVREPPRRRRDEQPRHDQRHVRDLRRPVRHRAQRSPPPRGRVAGVVHHQARRQGRPPLLDRDPGQGPATEQLTAGPCQRLALLPYLCDVIVVTISFGEVEGRRCESL